MWTFFVCSFRRKLAQLCIIVKKKGFACQIQFRKQDFCGLLALYTHSKHTSSLFLERNWSLQPFNKGPLFSKHACWFFLLAKKFSPLSTCSALTYSICQKLISSSGFWKFETWKVLLTDFSIWFVVLLSKQLVFLVYTEAMLIFDT